MKPTHIILAAVFAATSAILAATAERKLPAPMPEFKTPEQLAIWRKEMTEKAKATDALSAKHANSALPDEKSVFFTGKPYLQETGSYAFKFRQYDPELNRWTTSDPSGFPDGANCSRYSGSPTMGLDPNGKDWVGDIAFNYAISAGLSYVSDNWQSFASTFLLPDTSESGFTRIVASVTGCSITATASGTMNAKFDPTYAFFAAFALANRQPIPPHRWQPINSGSGSGTRTLTDVTETTGAGGIFVSSMSSSISHAWDLTVDSATFNPPIEVERMYTTIYSVETLNLSVSLSGTFHLDVYE